MTTILRITLWPLNKEWRHDGDSIRNSCDVWDHKGKQIWSDIQSKLTVIKGLCNVAVPLLKDLSWTSILYLQTFWAIKLKLSYTILVDLALPGGTNFLRFSLSPLNSGEKPTPQGKDSCSKSQQQCNNATIKATMQQCNNATKANSRQLMHAKQASHATNKHNQCSWNS